MRYWVDGEETDKLSALNRGLAYGDGVFETILCRHNTPLLWPQHIKRLQQGCTRLGLNCSSIEAQVLPLLNTIKAEYSVLKLIVCRAGIASGYLSDVSDTTLITIIKSYTPAEPTPVTIGLSDIPLNCNTYTAGIKHLSRLEQVLAARQATANHYDELFMFNTKQHLIEAISSNVFLYCDGQWLTPQLNESGVAGVMRQYCLEQVFPSLGLTCHESVLTASHVSHCEAAFLSNSIKGLVPVKAITQRSLSVDVCLPIISQASRYFNA